LPVYRSRQAGKPARALAQERNKQDYKVRSP
jgi:hypothetical protein